MYNTFKRSLLLLAIAVAVAVGWINNDGPGTRALLLPFRMARLMAAAPDDTLAMPVRGVSPDRVADTWQAARGASRRHEGQDIFAARGTPVVSATDGVVVRVGENALGGQTVSVMGGGGRIYYYAHLDAHAPGIRAGDLVSRGSTLLGYVGTTGNAQGTPPHLHFGVYGSKGALNPLPLLAAP